jgi:hypothetical protein
MSLFLDHNPTATDMKWWWHEYKDEIHFLWIVIKMVKKTHIMTIPITRPVLWLDDSQRHKRGQICAHKAWWSSELEFSHHRQLLKWSLKWIVCAPAVTVLDDRTCTMMGGDVGERMKGGGRLNNGCWMRNSHRCDGNGSSSWLWWVCVGVCVDGEVEKWLRLKFFSVFLWWVVLC